MKNNNFVIPSLFRMFPFSIIFFPFSFSSFPCSPHSPYLPPSFLFNIMTSELCVQGLKERRVQRLSSGNNTRLTFPIAISPRRMCAVIRGNHDGLSTGRLAAGTGNPGKLQNQYETRDRCMYQRDLWWIKVTCSHFISSQTSTYGNNLIQLSCTCILQPIPQALGNINNYDAQFGLEKCRTTDENSLF
jgi:hypothetical protein